MDTSLALTEKQKQYLKQKQKTDRVLAGAGLLLLSPVLLGIAAAIKLEDGLKAPVFFTQERIGQDRQHFRLYKFRTMKQDTPHDCPTHLLKNPDQYITKVGKFLRKSSLDELPQLWNIFRGEMAVVGPRPALWNQDDLIALREAYGVHQLLPGLTGLAQVKGRDAISIPEKCKWDRQYLKHVSLRTDIACLALTVGSVLRGDGVVEGGTGAMADKKEKVLVITNHSYMLYQFRRELLEALLQKGYEVVISTPFVGHEDDLTAMGCRCIRTAVDRRGMNPATDLKLLRAYDNLISQEMPDKVITYSIKPNIYAGFVCRRRKIPYYANVQGLGTAFQSQPMASAVSVLYRTALKDAKAVFFENAGNARQFTSRRIMAADRQVILPGAGINTERYHYMEYPSEETVHFLFVGRIMKEKGVEELFCAMRRLKREYGEKVILDVVGFFEDAYKEELHALEEQKIAVYYGLQEDVRPYYEQADCVVLPSWHEGMSNVLLEAASCGRPVITSDIPGCREAVEDDITGYLVPRKDAEALYRQMKRFVGLSRSDRYRMGLAGREKMMREFEKSRVVEQTMEVLEGK